MHGKELGHNAIWGQVSDGLCHFSCVSVSFLPSFPPLVLFPSPLSLLSLPPFLPSSVHLSIHSSIYPSIRGISLSTLVNRSPEFYLLTSIAFPARFTLPGQLTQILELLEIDQKPMISYNPPYLDHKETQSHIEAGIHFTLVSVPSSEHKGP